MPDYPDSSVTPARTWQPKNLRDRPYPIAQAATARIPRLPNNKIDDLQTQDQYIGGKSEKITILNLSKQVRDMNSPTLLKMALSKLPTHWRNMRGAEVTARRQDMSLNSLKEWLDQKLTGQEIGQADEIGMENYGEKIEQHRLNIMKK